MTPKSSRKSTRGVLPNFNRIIELRKNKNLTQEALATKADITKRTLQKMEAGERVDAESVNAIAKKLDVKDVQELILPDPPNEPPPPTRTGFLHVGKPPSDFTGRDKEIADILAGLAAGQTVGIAAVKAQGGMGKTTLAEKIAELAKDRFPTAIKVPLRGTDDKPPTASMVMTTIIRHFDSSLGQLPDDVEQLRSVYVPLLAKNRPLIILDNAHDAAQVEPLFRDPPDGVGFLITSRKQILHDAVRTIPLDALSPNESLALLRGIVGPSRGSDAELETVAELCTYLPLALRVAGTFLREKATWSVSRYVEALQADRLRWLKLGTVERDVEAALAFSVRQLVHDNVELAQRFQMLSVFPADFDTNAAASVWDLMNSEKVPDADVAFEELDQLLGRSLVEFEEERWSLHDLMRPVARRVFEYAEVDHPLAGSGEDRVLTAERRFAVYFQEVAKLADKLFEAGGEKIKVGLDLFDQEVVNIRFGFAWARDRLESDDLAVMLCREYPSNSAYVINLRLTPWEWIDWLTCQLQACRTLRDRQGEGNALGNLGNAWADLGDARKAIDFHEQVLTIAREIGDRRGERNALGNLGNALNGLGDTKKAIEFHEQTLVVSRELGDRHGEGNALGNLGNAWADLGDTKKAIDFYQQRLAIAREISDRRGESNALFNLAVTHATLGQFAEALPLANQALMFFESIGHQRYIKKIQAVIAKLRAALAK